MEPRTVILHYHLFKNAGTSVDRILRNNFPGRWETAEFPGLGGNNTLKIAEWIKAHPRAVAFSTHTAQGPVPQINGVHVIPVLLLRDPIRRILSAYRFERQQKAETFGAVLAKATDFENYVRVRLSLPNDLQCRNFQTTRLARMMPGAAPPLERAKSAFAQVSCFGLVERFDAAMARLQQLTQPYFPEFRADQVHMNRTDGRGDSAGRPDELNDVVLALLRQHNQDDIDLLQAAHQQLAELGPSTDVRLSQGGGHVY